MQLSYTKITAPITGRAGSISVKPGNLVKDNDAALVTLLQISPIEVSFGVPEELLPEVQKYNAQHPLAIEASSGGIASSGKLVFIDNSVDSTTGTIKLKARFDNAQHTLWPGQFVDVKATLNLERNRIVLPSRTVQTGPQGKFVWVMNADQTSVAIRPVNVERIFKPEKGGEISVINSGVKPGEMVISEGQMRLMPGAKIKVLSGESQTYWELRMKFTDLFIRRPITTTLIMVGILIFGLLSYFSLPVSNLPAVEYPTIDVSASLARRQSGRHGFVGRDTARSPVLYHPRTRQHVVLQFVRIHRRHVAI